MQMVFEAVAETEPGTKWQALFNRNWPDYRAWFLAKRDPAGPSLNRSIRQLRRFMPELMPTYDRLVELAGGDELAALVLSFYRPPAYLISCSQAVWSSPEGPLLIRNYDLDPALNEGVILHSAWHGRRVIAANECLWGAADGVNDAGLALSLAFGGRQVVGDGFGIPVILRYILEFCETTADAIDVLRRVPSHMAYNVTVLDKEGRHATVMVAPDRPAQVTRKPVATNHQQTIEWPEQARFSRTLERERYLLGRLAETDLTESSLIAAFLNAPLYSTDYRNGFGTLYTAVYRPALGQAEFHWPRAVWTQSFAHFQEGRRRVRYASRTVPHAGQPITDGAWAGSEFDQARWFSLLKPVLDTVRDALDAAGKPAPARFVQTFLDDWARSGQVPWEKLGSVWTGAPDRPSPPPC
jgi:predicted choloylglycine hydrolase